MKTVLLVAATAVALLMASPAFARDNCHVPEAKWQPKAKLQAKLEKEGWTVRQIKTWNGCYEAYGMKAGKRMEVFYMPDTFEVSADQREF